MVSCLGRNLAVRVWCVSDLLLFVSCVRGVTPASICISLLLSPFSVFPAFSPSPRVLYLLCGLGFPWLFSSSLSRSARLVRLRSPPPAFLTSPPDSLRFGRPLRRPFLFFFVLRLPPVCWMASYAFLVGGRSPPSSIPALIGFACAALSVAVRDSPSSFAWVVVGMGN